MKRLVEALDRVPKRVLIALNGLAGFTVAVFQLVILAVATPPPEIWRAVGILVWIVSIAASISAVAAAVGLSHSPSADGALAVQAVACTAGAASLVIWAVWIVFFGTPPGVGFAWSPGVLSLVLGYSVYLLRRSVLAAQCSRSPVLFYSHLWLAAAMLPIDIAVIVRVIVQFITRPAAA